MPVTNQCYKMHRPYERTIFFAQTEPHWHKTNSNTMDVETNDTQHQVHV